MLRSHDPRSRLLILAIDPDTQDEIAECIDEWQEAGLLVNTFLLDVGKSVEDFVAAFAGDPVWRPLDHILNYLPWIDITIVSIRSKPIGQTSQERVGIEESLANRLRKAYPATGELQPKLFTLSVYEPTIKFGPAHLPRNYSSHFIHEPTNFVDERLPRQPLGSHTAATLAFTAVVAGGGLHSQRESPVAGINDQSLDMTRRVRFLRAMGRAATAGFLLDKSIRRVIGPGAGTSLVETSGISVVDDDPKLLADLSKEVISSGKFYYQVSVDKPDEKVIVEAGLIQSLKEFFSGFGYYLGKAVETTVKSRIESRARTFLDAFQELLFGDDSTVRIKGASTPMSLEHSLEEIAKRSCELKDIEDFERIESRPIPTPREWRLLLSASLSALDGSSQEDGVSCLQKSGVRTVFRRPNVLGPAPSVSDFVINIETIRRFGFPDEFVSIDALDFKIHKRFESAIREARLDSIFSGDSGITSSKPETSKGRIRGSMSRETRIADRKDSVSPSTPTEVAVESVAELRVRFDAWRSKNKIESSGTLLFEIAHAVHEGIEKAKADYKFDEIKKIYEDASAITPPKRKSLSRLITGAGVFTGATLIAGFTLSRIGIGSLIGLPIALIFFIIWLFGTSATLGREIFKGAIELRKFDFACKKSDTELNRLIRLTLNAVREYSRLTFVERQLVDWSRAIREIAHAPFGRLSDITEMTDRLPLIPHPPQFAVSRFHSKPDQISTIDREVWMRILRIGYLSDVFRALRARWSDEYNMYAPGGLEPESDTGPFRIISRAERRKSGRILNPRSDLSQSFLHHELRASVTEGELESISRWFSDHHLSALFSELDHVDTDHHAFDKFSPEEFLLGLVDSKRPVDFDPNAFAPGVQPRVENIEFRFKWQGDARLGSFTISPDKPLHFVTWALDVGYCHSLDSLIGGRSTDEPPEPPKDSPRFRS